MLSLYFRLQHYYCQCPPGTPLLPSPVTAFGPTIKLSGGTSQNYLFCMFSTFRLILICLCTGTVGTYSVRLLITAVRNKYMIWFFVIWRNCPFKLLYYWPVCLADLLEATLVKLLQLLRRGRVTVRVVHWTGWTKLTSAHSCLVLLATTQFYFQD